MCGRFTLTANPESITKEFAISSQFHSEYQARFNIAPSQPILSVVSDGARRRAGYLKWGLIPFWAKDEKIGYKLINARAETLHEKVSFKQAYKKRRCLILADGFYEWKRVGAKKQPVRITLKDHGLFAMAGLWEKWRSPEGKDIYSCTIITTKPNELMENIHDRMPAILTKEAEAIWLDRNIEDPYVLQHVFQPYDAKGMTSYEVSTLVNSPNNESADLITPV